MKAMTITITDDENVIIDRVTIDDKEQLQKIRETTISPFPAEIASAADYVLTNWEVE